MREIIRSYPFLPFFVVALLLPILELLIPGSFRFADALQPIFIFAILALGLNIVTGYTGMLHLGVAGFMAIGAYTYAILTCDIYPFQLSFFPALFAAMVAGAIWGVILGLPTMRLSGDYLAIVTLGFGEIVQNLFRNLDTITKGTQGINPLPPPSLFGYTFDAAVYYPWYYLFLALLFVVVVLSFNLERSRIGRAWLAVREDELASSCMGIPASRVKTAALAIGSAISAMAGGLWVCYLGSSGEPGNYDFQISIIALCIIILGGMGSIHGVLIGAVVMIGFNSVLLVKAADFLMRQGFISTESVVLAPNNWKYMIFGFALILTMRFKPDGLFPKVGGRR